jgi:hypothetical protein
MELTERVRTAATENQLPCVVAHKLAGEWGVTPEDLGAAANAAGVKITRCQMGFFGYAPQKGMPGYSVVQPAAHVPEALAAEVRAALVNGRLPCRAAWEIAQRHGLNYRQMGDAVEALGIRVKPCQLGCF